MKEDKKLHIMKGDENLMDTAKELRKSGGETPQDIAALVRIQGLYRDISGIKNEQNKLREKLNNPNTQIFQVKYMYKYVITVYLLLYLKHL